MPLNDTAKNAALDHLGTLIGYASLHTAAAGTTGANEIVGGSYARKALTWAAAATGSKGISNQPVFDVPASTTVAELGLWSAVTAGTFYGSADVVDETFTNAGQYTVTSLTIGLT